MKVISMLLLSVLMVACSCADNSEVKILNNKTIIKKFESDANYIFGDRILDKYSFSSYNTDRLIFQIQSDSSISERGFLNNIEPSLKEKDGCIKKNIKKLIFTVIKTLIN